MPDVECDNCGNLTHKKPATIENNTRVFCSRECYHDFGRPDMRAENNPNATGKIEKTCEWCGDDFEVYPYREDTARFCSRECSDEFKTQITGPEHAKWTGGRVEYTCENCGGEFQRYPKWNDNLYCSKSCYREASKEIFAGGNNPVWRGGRVDNYGPNWQDQREKVLERDGYECQDCGTHADDMELSPHVHHKKRLGWYKEEYDSPEWYEKGNQVDNLVTLCPSCHANREDLGKPVTSG